MVNRTSRGNTPTRAAIGAASPLVLALALAGVGCSSGTPTAETSQDVTPPPGPVAPLPTTADTPEPEAPDASDLAARDGPCEDCGGDAACADDPEPATGPPTGEAVIPDDPQDDPADDPKDDPADDPKDDPADEVAPSGS